MSYSFRGSTPLEVRLLVAGPGGVCIRYECVGECAAPACAEQSVVAE